LRNTKFLAKNTNLDLIKKLLFIGNLNALQDHLDKLEQVVKDKNFIDSFKGAFMEKKFDIDINQVKQISKLKIK